MSNAIVVLLLLTAAPPVVTDQSLPAPRATARFGARRPASPTDPYRNLFAPPRDPKAADAGPNAAAQPRTVCGMTIIPADPSIVPRMLVPRRADGVDYKIRTIAPPICRSAR